MIAVVLPLRVPVDVKLDLQGLLSEWLDNVQQAKLSLSANQNDIADDEQDLQALTDLTADECQDDLYRLSNLRSQVAAVLIKESFAEALEALPLFQEYAAALLEFYKHGFLLDHSSSTANDPHLDDDDNDDDDDNGIVPHHQLHNNSNNSRNNNNISVVFRWKTAPMNDDASHDNNSQQRSGSRRGDDGFGCDSYHCLLWERANIIWNIVTLETYKASLKNLASKSGWVQAGAHFSNAAAVIRELLLELYDFKPQPLGERSSEDLPPNHISRTSSGSNSKGVALSLSVLHIWESFLMAEAQRAAYEAFKTLPRPKHFMLAKLAAGAVSLFQIAEDMLEHRQAAAINNFANPLDANDPVLEPKLMEWNNVVRAWGMWMTALQEYHQAVVHLEKQEWGFELARLEGALRFGRLCQAFCETVDHPLEEGLDHFDELLQKVETRQKEAEVENKQHRVTVPDRDDLPEIPMQITVKENPDITKIVPSLSQQFFTSVMDPTVRHFVHIFRSEMERILYQTIMMGEERTETGYKALASVHLPHSLTAYKQEQNGGGIPNDLWERVELVQREKRDDRLKQELWELRDLAETARAIHKEIENQLEEDLQMDGLFREQHGSSFEGHDVEEIQKAVRQSLRQHERLMASAERTDTDLLRRCEILDTDFKFKMLKLPKSQLDCLLPKRSSGLEYDVSSLSQYLIDLSTLFNERESLIHSLREGVKTYNIAGRLAAAKHEEEFQAIVDGAIDSFDGLQEELHANFELQGQLLDSILRENEEFMRARDVGQPSASSEGFIVKLEDALVELDQFTEDLKDGRAFYDGLIPKLNQLKQHVGDVSARLTIERCEFDDKVRRTRQEAEDARMAASYNQDAQKNGGGGGGGGSGSRSAAGQQRVRQVSHSEPDVRVDDEKVASLIAMDFDPERVVAALTKYDNNVEQALNDLLGC